MNWYFLISYTCWVAIWLVWVETVDSKVDTLPSIVDTEVWIVIKLDLGINRNLGLVEIISWILDYKKTKKLVFITCNEVTSDCNDVNEVWSDVTSVWSLETLVSKSVTFVSKVLTEVLRVVTSDSSVVILAPYREWKIFVFEW